MGLRGELDRLAASPPNATHNGATLRAARRLNRATGVLATSVLLDSAVEHYRGSFNNPAMVVPLLVSAMTLAVSAHGVADKRPSAHRVRQGIYGAGAVTGLLGTGFHIYNVLKRPGAASWQNLFYGAPLGAPMAILLAGLLGSAAEAVRDNPAHRARMFGLPAGRLLSAISGLGLLGTTAEAGLLHFRGAFHDPAMFAPVTTPPAGGALLLNAAWGVKNRDPLARWWLRLVAWLGLAGVGFSRWCHCASGRSGSSRAVFWGMAPTGRSIGARCGRTMKRSNRR